MDESQPPRVEGLTREIAAGGGQCRVGNALPARLAIQRIADDGQPLGLEVDPDLVHAAGQETAAQEGQANTGRRLGAAERMPESDAGTPFGPRGDHPPLAFGIAQNTALDAPARSVRRSVDDGQVVFLDGPAADRLRQPAVDGSALGRDDDPRGALVQPADKPGSDRLAASPSQMPQERVEESAPAVAKGGVDHQARRLGQRDQPVVFIEDVERDLFGDRRRPGRERCGEEDLHLVAQRDAIRRTHGRGSVDPYAPRFDPRLEARAGEAGDVREPAHQDAVETM
jgi:hypothetical protein